MNHTGILTSAPSVIESAKQLIADGYAVTPIHGKTKKPKLHGWPGKKISASEIEQYFSAGDNLAVILGEKSGGLTNVDFDHPIAKQFASFLPETVMVHGRPGNPASHYWYLIEGVSTTKKFAAPGGKMLVEFLSSSCLTMVPPSIHPDGDQLEWVKHGIPALVDAAVLVAAVAKIAAATLLSIHWPKKGSRNDAALALAGGLLRAGWKKSDTASFIGQVAKAAGDEEYQARAECAESTATKLQAGDVVTGLPTLASLMSSDVVSKIAEWLCLDTDSGQGDQVDAIVEELNNLHAVVSIGGGTWIMNEIVDSATKLPDVTFSRKGDFQLRYESRRILTKSEKPAYFAERDR